MTAPRMTTSEAARELGVSSRHVVRLADDGELFPVRTAYGRLFFPEDVARLREIRETDRRRLTHRLPA